MPRFPSRREVLAVLPAIAVAGCAGESPASGSTPTRSEVDTPTQTPTATATPTASPLDRLPEPSPLTAPLRQLVVAEDPATVASQLGMDYRDGHVKVVTILVEGGDPPLEYFAEDAAGASGQVVGYVAVSALVDLAIDQNVRLVRAYKQPETQAGTTE